MSEQKPPEIQELFAQGLMRWTARICTCMFIVWCGINLLLITPLARDSTDPGEWGKRSGLVIKKDEQTGCQYLSASGGLTPRLNEYGVPICDKTRNAKNVSDR